MEGFIPGFAIPAGVIVSGFLLLVWSEYGEKCDPLDADASFKQVMDRRKSPSLIHRFIGWSLPWRQVVDRKRKVWIYKSFRGVVFKLECTGLTSITQEEYNDIFNDIRSL